MTIRIGDVIEVNQREYKVEPVDEDKELCEGCAAKGDDFLCEMLPDCARMKSVGDDDDLSVVFKLVE